MLVADWHHSKVKIEIEEFFIAKRKLENKRSIDAYQTRFEIKKQRIN